MTLERREHHTEEQKSLKTLKNTSTEKVGSPDEDY